jgi:hypothetical protein
MQNGENFRRFFGPQNVPPYPCRTTLNTIKDPRMDADMLCLPEKGIWKQHRTKAASVVLTIGIMTGIRQGRIRKNPVSMV